MAAPTTAVRTACVWCPDWSVTAARDADPTSNGVPVAIVARGTRGRVVTAVSAEARAEGVTVGLRRREAEARCPDLVVLDDDSDRDARTFEIVARAVETVSPRVVMERPGRLSFPTRGPARYFGGDDPLAARVLDAILAAGVTDARLGIADGGFAAWLAARATGPAARMMVIAPHTSRAFLAPWPVTVLGDAGLTELLPRLGLRTLGAFAALPTADVLARFGAEGAAAHRRAAGTDDDPVLLTTPPPELVAVHGFDPPESRLDAAAFAAKALADRFLGALAARGHACARVRIEAETEHGETHARVWRHDGALTPSALADRARWQLDAWLTAAGRATATGAGRGHRGYGEETADAARAEQDAAVLAALELDDTTGALLRLRFVPEEIIPLPARQLGLWGGDQIAHDRAARALVRVQAMLGHDAVVTAVEQGGRTPGERVRWVPWGAPRESEPGRRTLTPWPGAVPAPAPARVFDPPLPVDLLDAAGHALRVSGRGEASDVPARLRWTALPPGAGAVTAWAGPWAHDVRWWDHRTRRRRVLWQLLVDAGGGRALACLVAGERGRFGLEAIYD